MSVPIDWTEYDRLVNLFRAGSPNIAKAFDENKRITNLVNGGAPPAGTLRWKPPGYPDYNGYVRINATNGAEFLNLDNTKDYLIDMGTKSWSSGQSRTFGLGMKGGRNKVVIGGGFAFTSTNNKDDASAVYIEGGADNGITHLEGLDMDCPNGITLASTKQIIQIENCRDRARTWNDDYNGGAGIHPDVVQVWSSPVMGFRPAAIRMHKFTGLTRYTGLVCLESDPLIWERYEVNLAPDQNLNGKMDASNYAYMSCGPNANEALGPYCEYKGEVYAELPTGGGGAYVRKIDDIVITKTASPLTCHPYEIHAPDGSTLYTSPLAPTGGNSTPAVVGLTTGNYLTFSRIPKFAAHKWIIGKPPGGDFVPAGVPGPAYVSPGYLP